MSCEFILTRGPRIGTKCGRRCGAGGVPTHVQPRLCVYHLVCEHGRRRCGVCRNRASFAAVCVSVLRMVNKMCAEIEKNGGPEVAVEPTRDLLTSVGAINLIVGAAINAVSFGGDANDFVQPRN